MMIITSHFFRCGQNIEYKLDIIPTKNFHSNPSLLFLKIMFLRTCIPRSPYFSPPTQRIEGLLERNNNENINNGKIAKPREKIIGTCLEKKKKK